MVDCTDKLSEQFPDLDKKQIQAVVDAHEKIKGTKDYAKKSKQLRLNNALEVKARAKNVISDAVAIRKNQKEMLDTKWERPQEAFQAKFAGISPVKDGGNFNFLQVRDSYSGRFMHMVKQAVPKELKEIAISGKFDVEIADAMFLLNNNAPIRHFSLEVQKIAKGLRSVNKGMIDALRDAGVDIRERADYITRQSHSREKIQDFKTWSEDIMRDGVLDKEKTFGGISNTKDQMNMLKKMFDRIQEDGLENHHGTFGGERSIHFANGRAWAEYNESYGHGSIYDSVLATVSSSSRAYANSTVFGTMNGKKIWEGTEKKILKKLNSEGKVKELDEFKRGQGQRNAWKAEMFGYDRHPGRFNYETWSRTANLVQSGALLGKSAFTTFSDLALSSFNFRAATGKGGFVEFESVKSFIDLLPQKNADKWAKRMDMYLEDEMAEVFQRFGSFVGGGNKTSKGLEWYKKAASLTGLGVQSSRAQLSNARMFSTELGDNADIGFEKLNPRLQANLKRFNIDESDWKIISSATKEYENGLKAIVPEAITPEMGIDRKTANTLRTKLATYLADNAKAGFSGTSGLERATITQGLSPNTPMGAFLRTAGQFKAFPLSVPRLLGRISQSNPNATPTKFMGVNIPTDKGDIALLGGVMTQMTLLAGASIVVKNAISGRKTDVTDPKFMMDAFAQGAVPLMFTYTLDAMKGEYDTYGRSFLKDLAGPTFGQFDEVESLISKSTDALIDVFEGKKSANNPAAVAAMKLVIRNAPGQNLPFVKPLLNKAFLTSFYEHYNKGYEARLKRSAQRRGTEFLFNPL